MANLKINELSHNLKPFFNDLADHEIQSIKGGQQVVPAPTPYIESSVPAPTPYIESSVPASTPYIESSVPAPTPYIR